MGAREDSSKRQRKGRKKTLKETERKLASGKKKGFLRHSVWVTSGTFNFPYRFGKFLCLTADVFPPGDPRDHRDKLKEDDFPIPSKNVRFMVDSGSDIVTLSDHVIEELKLPVIGRCQQEVAGGDIRDVSLYSACLGIGKRKLNITVRLRGK